LLDFQLGNPILGNSGTLHRSSRLGIEGRNMIKNVLDAIREGDGFFEPDEVDPRLYPATAAIPGTDEKLEVLAARVRAGLPLWHKSDRPDYDDPNAD
jgi:hypothetical protein